MAFLSRSTSASAKSERSHLSAQGPLNVWEDPSLWGGKNGGDAFITEFAQENRPISRTGDFF